MSLSDIEKEILAEGERIRALAHKGALEVRKLHLVEELTKIEEELARLVAGLEGKVVNEPAPEPDPEPAPAPTPEPEQEPESPVVEEDEEPEAPADAPAEATTEESSEDHEDETEGPEADKS